MGWRTGETVDMVDGRDVWWQDKMMNAEAECAPVEMDAEDPLFILYTSGSTGKPKGVPSWQSLKTMHTDLASPLPPNCWSHFLKSRPLL